MNREELKDKILGLPLFEKRRTKNETGPGTEVWVLDEKNNSICQIGKNTPVAYVGKGYHLMQFKEVFMPILEEIENEVEGYVIHHEGFAQLILFPHRPELSDEHSKYGVVAMNSVDCSSAIVIKFCVDYNGRRVIIPPKVAGVKKMHTQSAKNMVKNYMKMIGPVKDVWNQIVNEFPKYQIVMENPDETGFQLELSKVSEQLKLGPRLEKVIKERLEHAIGANKDYTLWKVFVDAVDILSDKKFKSEVHQERRLEKLSQQVFNYAAVLAI